MRYAQKDENGLMVGQIATINPKTNRRMPQLAHHTYLSTRRAARVLRRS